MIIQTDPNIVKLRELGNLIQVTIAQYVTEAQQLIHDNQDPLGGTLPPKALFNAQRTLLAASGCLTELVSDPSSRLLEVSSQYFEARALHIAADQRIAEILAEDDNEEIGEGVSLEKLAIRTGIESRKLSRIMRCLCSIHIFREVREDVFANNQITKASIGNEALRAYILMFGLDIYSASDYLPRTLGDPAKGSSYDVACTPWQDAVGSGKPRWEWLEETTSIDALLRGLNGSDEGPSAYPGPFGEVLKSSIESKELGERVSRPEHKIFGLAMLGGGRVFGQAHLYDFPWASLGSATVVDVGGGVGGFSLQLSLLFNDLKFVVQDRAPVLAQASSEVWPSENPSALQTGRVRFVPHDFFHENPVKNAEVYWLRYILHDWSDDYCVQILSGIKASMGVNSRIIICDQIMNTTLGSKELPSAPSPLPANWGYYTRYSHQRDLAMMSIINGIERKPAEFDKLAQRAGLKLRKIWGRSQVGLVEMVLPESPL